MAASATVPTRAKSVEADASQWAVAQHLGLVYHLARALMRSRGIAIELDELVSAGTLGLIDAVANFDPTRGLAFTTFATPRIRGAMLDELRRLDHVPRSVRRRARELHAANDTLCGELGTSPDDTQVAEHLGIDVATLWRWRADATAQTVPLAHLECDGEAVAEALCTTTSDCDVDDALTREQELSALKDAILTLGSRERAVLSLYYYEELRLHQIAEVLGVSESRVSQIRTQAISRLRAQMVRFRDGPPTQAAVSSSRRRASVSVGNLST